MSPALDYFNKASANYERRSSSGLWGLLRSYEKKVLLSMHHKKTVSSILDLGCGSGFYTGDLLKLNPGAKMTAVDFSTGMLERLQDQRVEKICADIDDFSPNKKFDLIVCAGALEFTRSPIDVLKRAESWLSPSGKILLLVPQNNFFSTFYRQFHKRHQVDIHVFSAKQLTSALDGLFVARERKAFPLSLCLELTRPPL